VFLLLMISAGATLSRLALGSYPMLVAVSCLDFSIAIALLGSCPVFWKEGSASHRRNACGDKPSS
jgi:hypothetical protein